MKTTKILFISVLLLVFGVKLQAQKTAKVAEADIKTSAQCGECVDRITKGLTYEKGILAVNLDLKTNILNVRYKTRKTNKENIQKAVVAMGYDADDMMANKEAHDSLPGCCQKDGEACGDPAHKQDENEDDDDEDE